MHVLWKYANEGHIAAIQKLFSDAKASPHDVNFMGQSALYYATEHPKLYRFLIENGGDPEVTDIHGNKPTELIGERLLSAELEEEDAYAIRKSLEETDFMETRQFTLIHKLALGLVTRSLEDQLEISTAQINSQDSKGRTPLSWATLRNDQKTVETLLAFGADPNICDNSGNSCLHFVRSPELCSALLDKKADVHIAEKTLGMSCMQAVCKRSDDPKVIELLHSRGADVNFRDNDGETPLMNAIFKRHSGAARRLIDLGADVNAANHSSHDTPIHFAVTFDHHEILPLLLRKGADPSIINRWGHNVASDAAVSAGPKTMKALAEADLTGINLAAKDGEGKIATDYMAERVVFEDSETETREAFQMLLVAIEESNAAADDKSRDFICTRTDSDRIQVPGAFPKLSR